MALTQATVDGARHVLGPGDTIEVPRGTRHTFANAGAHEMRVRFEFRPALTSTERFYELYFAFAHEGRVNAKSHARPTGYRDGVADHLRARRARDAPTRHSTRPVSRAGASRPNHRTPATDLPASRCRDRTVPHDPNQRPPTRLTGAGATIDRRPRRSSVWSAATKTRQGNRAEDSPACGNRPDEGPTCERK